MLIEDLDALLARSQAGDHAAFAQIVGQVQGPLSRYLLHLVGDRELAADLTQDTLLDLFESLGRVPVRQVAPWLYRVATNNALSALRRRTRVRWLPLDWLRGHPTPAPPLDGVTAERLAVRQALAGLRPDQVTCLLLHDMAGFSCSEIAAHLQISLAATKQRLARGRRAFLAAYTAPPPLPDHPRPQEQEDRSYVP